MHGLTSRKCGHVSVEFWGINSDWNPNLLPFSPKSAVSHSVGLNSHAKSKSVSARVCTVASQQRGPLQPECLEAANFGVPQVALRDFKFGGSQTSVDHVQPVTDQLPDTLTAESLS